MIGISGWTSDKGGRPFTFVCQNCGEALSWLNSSYLGLFSDPHSIRELSLSELGA